MPLDQNPHQKVTRFGCFGVSMYAWGLSVPQMQQFCLFTYPTKSKWASSEKMIFFAKIGIFCKSIAGILCEGKTHWMVNWLQLLKQNSSQWCLRNSQLLRTTVNWCCRSSNILGCTHYFWLFTLWFIDEEASFFHFFYKITNIRSWRCFSSFKIVWRKDKTNYLRNQTWAKCYHSRNTQYQSIDRTRT